MNGIEVKSGINNCLWNVSGKCTNTDVTKTKTTTAESKRDWDSQINCPFTIYGAFLCSGFFPEGQRQYDPRTLRPQLPLPDGGKETGK
jgi:hypothetical protein